MARTRLLIHSVFLFLLPLGIINETHEPTTFYGVERNPAYGWKHGFIDRRWLLLPAPTIAIRAGIGGSNGFNPKSSKTSRSGRK